MSTLFGDICYSALRRAGITTTPGNTPSSDQTNELIPEANRLLSSWSLDGHKIFNISIDRYAMNPNQTTYFIGPTGDFVAPRPINIQRANVVLVNSSPELHEPIYILDDREWAAHVITELPMPWPYQIYNDGAYPDSKLYLFGFPTEINDLELFTWNELSDGFTSVSDLVSFPPGYEAALVPALALKARALNPLDARLSVSQVQELRDEARVTLEAVQILNTECLPYNNEAASIGPWDNAGGDLKSAFYRWGSGLP